MNANHFDAKVDAEEIRLTISALTFPSSHDLKPLLVFSQVHSMLQGLLSGLIKDRPG